MKSKAYLTHSPSLSVNPERAKRVEGLILVVFVFTLIPLLAFSQETLTITTYYPSPYGSYRELTSHRMKIGTTYSGSGTTVSDNNLIVEGSVGIGTTSLNQTLSVHSSSTQGMIGISGVGDGNLTYSALYLHDDTPDNTNNWVIGHKKRIGTPEEGDLHIARWINPSTLRTDIVVDKNTGNVGIGTVSPAAKLDIAGNIKIVDGTQGANKVLTSNASGLASWQTPPGGVFPITIGKWQNPGNGSYLGQWDYCSLTLVAGVDDDSGEGVGVYPSFVGTWNSAATRPGWWVWVGSDMNQWEIVCIKFGS